MKELDSLKESAKQLKLINAKNKASLIVHALINDIKLALGANISKKDIWRALVEISILGNNSYTSFLRILNPLLKEQKVLVETDKADKPEPKPVVTAKIPVANKPHPQPEIAKPETPTIGKNSEDFRPKTFSYNPMSNKEDLI